MKKSADRIHFITSGGSLVTANRGNKEMETVADPTSAASDAWYYADKGERNGPCSKADIEQLIRNGTIKRTTSLWSGAGAWTPAEELFAAMFAPLPESGPPPLASEDVDNRFVWAVVAVPLVGVLIELLASRELVWLYVAANVICCVLDERKLKSAGHKVPASWMTVLVPVYLWQRASLLSQKKHYFWAWIAAFLLSTFIGWGGNEANLEASACPVVTQIVQRQFGGGAACKSVSIDEEVSDGFYRATATLDNGNDLSITIEKKGDDQIYVRIPYDQ
ncbi:MAG TPA: DUF4339 domain-containing protein [Frateuria sp.]|uniref:DUF4339 domain-containing protein n=1 Tax=Frateuria sp. TaxID=2211372 RepID=UPI002D7ED194|nr:DUF4339 domain-containing protein [Frateuria sp.]HET6807093.1 DUF4339 domain-containing protein [Frateuria sp.]